ncbi:sulfatase-like hydrolase/transferase [Paenibacillus sp. JDR-2]|uniref:sulfatase-like hydrolase/transferase n=1 Tax=Paenibacillus sp. (strain JDR-2) TaxID=324057 RepID=UPI000166B083|nr:sulfatase-like hydrolase/transferase [Paenibacillus sp. JDR-2]ACS99264.1 sulfatase [Paenibacillus sp. JDR-2]
MTMAEKPNILLLLVDEMRYPPLYEKADIRVWREQNLVTQQWLRDNGLEFHRHYIGSAACAPSRTTLFTGHYPSLHGVTQTNGIAKQAADSDMFWLDRNTVPTMGDYFREAGYRTFYKGKWHLSYEDIIVPGTQQGLPSYNPATGYPDHNQDLYENADRLEAFGFSSWIGPEPHGRNPRDSGSSAGSGASGRDEFYAAETVQLIEALEQNKLGGDDESPWLIVTSLVNPHDITLYGDLTARIPAFRFDVGPVPDIDPPPTRHENLHTKPRCQASYRDLYPVALQPITNEPFYRKLYYQLQKNADEQLRKVVEALARTSFYEDTIIILTSDHGDLLGSHGGLHQKMYCVYEEVLRVPLLVCNKKRFPEPRSVHSLTSHLDLLPTLLGLAGINSDEIRGRLDSRFSEARPLIGRNLAGAMSMQPEPEAPVYFMTDDDIMRGQHQISPVGIPYPSVAQPNHIETVIAPLYRNGHKEYWKLSRYYDNPQFWSEPGILDVTYAPVKGGQDNKEIAWASRVRTVPVQEEYELYSLTDDPLETRNLANPAYSATYMEEFALMMNLLTEQRSRKRLAPGRN